MFAVIENIINMIPPQFYFPQDPEQLQKKFQKYTGKVQKAPKHERKLEALERKRARLDPNQPKATDRIGMDDDKDDVDVADDDDDDDDDDDAMDSDEEEQEEDKQKGAKATQAAAPAPKSNRGQRDAAAAEDDDDDDGDSDDGDDSDDADGDVSAPELPSLDKGGRLIGAARDEQPLSVSALKARMADKLSQLRGERGGKEKAPGERSADAKAKKKQKKHVAGGEHKHKPRGGEDANGHGGGGGGDSAAPAEATTGGVRASSSSIEFNKLAAAAAEPGGKEKKRKLSTQALLAQAEERERKKKARMNAPDGGGEDLQIGEWQRALQKAGGIKQRDNPKLLRKALKKKEQSKKKSTKEWANRVKTVAKASRDKQDARTKNLAERKTKNKSKSARQKARAGFEGKKSSFL